MWEGYRRTRDQSSATTAHMRGDDTPSCVLPYDNGRWNAATTAAARGCIMDSLQRDLKWWRTESCHGRPEQPISHVPDIEATLCRVRAQNPHTVLTNMMLLQSRGGNLSALFMVDPGDERGPRRHWPGRPIAAIQQLAELQQRVHEGALPPLPDFVAILNPHDQPQQMAPNGWCGLLPILSNSRTAGAHRDLLMPDYSFASTMYLTNSLLNMSQGSALPQGWPDERASVYQAGIRAEWAKRRKTLFWRGGPTHPQRQTYADGLSASSLRLPNGLAPDAFLCDKHCSSGQGVPPAAWCENRMLLSMPGHSFAVGFKYTMLCGSLVVRGATGACNTSACEDEFAQWWQAGLRENEHYVASKEVDDLPQVLGRVGLASEAEAIGRRGADYAFNVLDPAFVLEYWHALLSGYAALHEWKFPLTTLNACKRPPPRPGLPIGSLNKLEQACLKGPRTGQCQMGDGFRLVAESEDFVPIQPPEIVASESGSKAGLARLYSRYARVVPGRFGGVSDINREARDAIDSSGIVVRSSANYDAGPGQLRRLNRTKSKRQNNQSM
jgi:hypothetical protein